MKKNRIINKVLVLSSVLLIAAQFTACGTQSMMDGLTLGESQSLNILEQSAQTDGDFNVLAAAKKPAAKPAPKKLPPPQALTQSLYGCTQKTP